MSTRLFHTLIALSGIIGVIMLITSFAINPGPPSGTTYAQLIAFGNEHGWAVRLGAWLQATSPCLIVLFAFGVVHLAGAANRLAGWMTLFGGVVLTMVSLVEVAFYLSAINGDPTRTLLVSLDFIHAVQSEYSMVAAPLLFLPLGLIIVSSRVLPRILGYLAFVLGGLFVVLGLPVLFVPSIQTVVDMLSIIQGVWWLAAAVTLLVLAGKTSFVVGQSSDSMIA
ncbi:MAG TPA: DUF4386 family protein [Ktedonosporobacter sp.]|jgi:hypothetical protein|nr:DUF4386 family protein [Ktedonosporobacter sp.]